jgi:antagonist of KipI
MSLQITNKGVCDTVQDGGRNGFRHLGIGPAGPMDPFAAQLANALLGKEENSPVIELHFPAAAIRFHEATIVCVTGADFTPHVNGQPVALRQPYYIPADSLLQFRENCGGRCCYLALAHELDLQPWLGSVSTHTKGGGPDGTGRTLQKGETIQYKNRFLFNVGAPGALQPLHWQPLPLPGSNDSVIHVLIGNEWAWLTRSEAALFLTATFSVSAQSDRMGFRLHGPALREMERTQLLSAPVAAGTVQLLPDGTLIILMADHQTTGGYPKLGHITRSGIGKLAQKSSHASFSFSLTDLATAQAETREERAYLHRLKISSTFKMKNFLDAAL